MFYDRGNHYEFLSLVQELAAPGELQHPQTFPFNFKNIEKQYESYNGINVKLRYFVRVTVSRRMADVVREKDLWVYSYRMPPETNSPIKMDVGIEDCLHIEFEYSKSKYHLKDVIVGRIYFLLVRLKIKHMELSIIRRETTGSPPNQYNESEPLVRFEVSFHPSLFVGVWLTGWLIDHGWFAFTRYVASCLPSRWLGTLLEQLRYANRLQPVESRPRCTDRSQVKQSPSVCSSAGSI